MPFSKQRSKKFKLRTVVCGKAPRETTKIIIISETIFYSALINNLTYFFRCFHCCRSSCRTQSGNMNLQSSTFKQPKYRRAWSSIISMILFRALTHIHRRIAHVFRIFNRGIFSLSLFLSSLHTHVNIYWNNNNVCIAKTESMEPSTHLNWTVNTRLRWENTTVQLLKQISLIWIKNTRTHSFRLAQSRTELNWTRDSKHDTVKMKTKTTKRIKM